MYPSVRHFIYIAPTSCKSFVATSKYNHFMSIAFRIIHSLNLINDCFDYHEIYYLLECTDNIFKVPLTSSLLCMLLLVVTIMV